MKLKFTLLFLTACIYLNIYIQAQIPTNGLIAYYPFNGNANDESGNMNNGLVNGATLTTDRCDNPNSAYYFDGISNYIELGSNSVFKPSNITVSCWFNTTYNSSFTVQLLRWRLHGYGITFNDYNTSIKGLLVFCHESETINNEISNNNYYADGKWHLVVLTFDSLTIKMYVDNILIGAKNRHTKSPIFYDSGGIAIARDGDYSGAYYNGKLDDIRIYDHALNSNEVSSLYYTNCINQNFGEISGSEYVCQGQKSVGYNALNMENVTSYNWSYTGTGAAIHGNSDNILIDLSNNATSGYLKVFGYNNVGNIVDSATFLITVNPLPSDASTISGNNIVCHNQSEINYNTLQINNASNYIWNFSGTGATIFGNSDNIKINFSQNATSGNLTVLGTNSCGTGKSSPDFPITVNSCDQLLPDNFNIPNTFSPNGDGINDVFVIKGLTENSKLIIFDRFGKKLYESNNYQNNWTGNDIQGKNLSTNTYWYVLILRGFPTEFKGFIFLKR